LTKISNQTFTANLQTSERLILTRFVLFDRKTDSIMAITAQKLLKEIQSVANDLGRTPMPEELDDQGEYEIEAYRHEFGSWYGAISKAGFEKPQQRRIPEEELLAELRRLGSELDKVPSEQDMTAEGGYGTSTYRKRFGSCSSALEEAGFDPHSDRRWRSKDELIAEMERLSEKYGRPPTSREMDEEGDYSRGVYRDRFGSWNEALEAGGFDERTHGTKIPREDLIGE
jgi:hypothetical protein